MQSDLKFEFDKNKSQFNKLKHGISLQDASKLWSDPYRIEGPGESIFEERWIVVGSIKKQYWTAVFVNRGEKIRLISCRKARKEEIKIYEYSK